MSSDNAFFPNTRNVFYADLTTIETPQLRVSWVQRICPSYGVLRVIESWSFWLEKVEIDRTGGICSITELLRFRIMELQLNTESELTIKGPSLCCIQ